MVEGRAKARKEGATMRDDILRCGGVIWVRGAVEKGCVHQALRIELSVGPLSA